MGSLLDKSSTHTVTLNNQVCERSSQAALKTNALCLLRAVPQQQPERGQVSLGSSVVNRYCARIGGGRRVHVASLQQPVSDLVVTEAGCEVENGGTGIVPVLSVKQKENWVWVFPPVIRADNENHFRYLATQFFDDG